MSPSVTVAALVNGDVKLTRVKGAVVESKTHFILNGFSQVKEFRVFEFQGITVDSVRSLFTVSIDLALARKYGIRLQDLPLLCRGVLDQCAGGEEKRAFTYTEGQMRSHANTLAEREEAARYKRPPREPAPDHVGAAGRVPAR
jgi:hypothetical protein